MFLMEWAGFAVSFEWFFLHMHIFIMTVFVSFFFLSGFKFDGFLAF